MWRSLIAATIVYASGHPSLDGYRPAILDRPLHAFHDDVNTAARQGKAVLTSLDETRYVRFLKFYIDRIAAQLHGE